MLVLDRIERKVLLNASRKQIWEALTDAEKFGSWFG
ncbi:vanillate O-demethylase oxidoreductase VanB, partial [Pseudomonas sp. SIMBA_065]